MLDTLGSLLFVAAVHILCICVASVSTGLCCIYVAPLRFTALLSVEVTENDTAILIPQGRKACETIAMKYAL